MHLIWVFVKWFFVPPCLWVCGDTFFYFEKRCKYNPWCLGLCLVFFFFFCIRVPLRNSAQYKLMRGIYYCNFIFIILKILTMCQLRDVCHYKKKKKSLTDKEVNSSGFESCRTLSFNNLPMSHWLFNTSFHQIVIPIPVSFTFFWNKEAIR